MTNTARKPPAAGMGRPKGSKNKSTAALKDAILGALSNVGGQAYLEKVANDDPRTFCTLIGKVLPMTVVGNMDVAATVTFQTVYAAKDN